MKNVIEECFRFYEKYDNVLCSKFSEILASYLKASLMFLSQILNLASNKLLREVMKKLNLYTIDET